MHLRRLTWFVQSLALGLVIYDVGFKHTFWLSGAYAGVACLLLLSNLYFHIREKSARKLSWAPTLAFGLALSATLVKLLGGQPLWAVVEKLHDYYLAAIGVYFLHRISLSVQRIFSQRVNPATLFVGSFAGLILLGTLLLLLPTATTGRIGVIDALFTATSAVCVTGLIVVDTAKDFTFFGQCVILVLIQLGGLGILTFTSFFAYFFKGGSSLQETLHLRDIVSSEHLGNVFKVLIKIVVFTFAIELVGALGIYYALASSLFDTWYEKAFFAAFHSVSAFCNAGFSTLTDGLYDAGIRFHYGLQWMVMLLIVSGGIGFNILNNFYELLKTRVKTALAFLGGNTSYKAHARIISLNSRLVVTTTLLLLVSGMFFFLFAESGATLAAHTSWWGKLTGAFFCSVTPRTAGFNTVDMGSLSTPAVMATIALMWIGASPASTGGGIKTSTFALAVLNIGAVVRGRSHIEIGRREVPIGSMQRAFAIIVLSIFSIGVAVFLLSWLEPGKELIALVFECVSAYSTVGLSLGITSGLSAGGKCVLIALMFVGRVGTINLLTGMLQRMHHIHYRYPEESVIIN